MRTQTQKESGREWEWESERKKSSTRSTLVKNLSFRKIEILLNFFTFVVLLAANLKYAHNWKDIKCCYRANVKRFSFFFICMGQIYNKRLNNQVDESKASWWNGYCCVKMFWSIGVVCEECVMQTHLRRQDQHDCWLLTAVYTGIPLPWIKHNWYVAIQSIYVNTWNFP